MSLALGQPQGCTGASLGCSRTRDIFGTLRSPAPARKDYFPVLPFLVFLCKHARKTTKKTRICLSNPWKRREKTVKKTRNSPQKKTRNSKKKTRKGRTGLLLPLSIFGEIQESGPCTKQSGSQRYMAHTRNCWQRKSSQGKQGILPLKNKEREESRRTGCGSSYGGVLN